MSAPAKVNSDVPLPAPKPAAKPPANRLTLKVHASLDDMRAALQSLEVGGPARRESAFKSITGAQQMNAQAAEVKKEGEK